MNGLRAKYYIAPSGIRWLWFWEVVPRFSCILIILGSWWKFENWFVHFSRHTLLETALEEAKEDAESEFEDASEDFEEDEEADDDADESNDAVNDSSEEDTDQYDTPTFSDSDWKTQNYYDKKIVSKAK